MNKLLYFVILLMVKAAIADTSQLYLLHLNGLNSTREKAVLNTKTYQSVATVSSNVIWNLVYNPTQSGSEWSWVASIKGFIDVCIQKWYESNQLPTFDQFTQQAMTAQGVDYPVGSPQYKQFQSNLVNQFQQLLIDDGGKNMGTIVDEFHNAVPAQYAGVMSLLSNSGQNDYSNSKAYVILLPHSQGNTYANNLYTYLTQTEKFNPSKISIFGFASPAKVEQGQMTCNASIPNYITSTNDGLIASARLVFGNSSVLPTNITISKNPNETTGHGLIENYLASKNSTDSLNAFLNITSNNCFQGLHDYEHIGTTKNSGNIVYDAVSKNLIQADNNQICEFNTESYADWNCNSYTIPFIINYTLSTDGMGSVYMLATDRKNGIFLITYKHDAGVTNLYLVESASLSGPTAYYNNALYSLDMVYGPPSTTNWEYLYTNARTFKRYTAFNNVKLGFVAHPLTIDNAGNIYTVDWGQVYYQKLAESQSGFNFGSQIANRDGNDIFNVNNVIYVCGEAVTYYLPTNSLNNTPWLAWWDHGCDRITGNSQNLFIIDGDGLYRYKL